MKRKLIIPAILIAGLLAVNLTGFVVYSQTPQKKTTTEQTMKYTCPMHKDVVMDKPGNCPECGMKLVEMKDMAKGNMHQINDSMMMKHGNMNMMHNSKTMKNGHMMHDTTRMKKGTMKHDTASMKHDRMNMNKSH